MRKIEVNLKVPLRPKYDAIPTIIFSYGILPKTGVRHFICVVVVYLSFFICLFFIGPDPKSVEPNWLSKLTWLPVINDTPMNFSLIWAFCVQGTMWYGGAAVAQ